MNNPYYSNILGFKLLQYFKQKICLKTGMLKTEKSKQ